jgi:hypothetical protein
MKLSLPLLLAAFVSLPVFANEPPKTIQDYIQIIEQSCDNKKYSDSFVGGESNHAQIYCVSAYEFSCLKQADKVKKNCEEIKRLNLLDKCAACDGSL